MALTIRSKAFLSAAVAALPAFFILGWSSPAQGQYQIQGGHDLDANPRIGSGGYNGNGTSHYNYNVNNNIVTGNVSGLNYFHGNRSGEFDTNTFAGNTGSSSFNGFNNASAPVDYAHRDTGIPNYVPSYNSGNFVGQPPQNYITTQGGTNYIPAPVISPLTPTAFDSRLELTNTDPTRGNLLSPGVLNIAGPVDPSSGSQSIYSMSPLYGVRSEDAMQQSTFFNSNVSNTRLTTPADRMKLTPAQVQQMRDELNTTVVPNGQSNNTNVTPAPVSGAVDINQADKLNAITPNTNNLAGAQLNSAVANPAIGNGLNSGEGQQNQVLLPSATRQSKQLQALEEKYAKDKAKLTDAQAAEKFNEEKRLLKTQAAATGTDGKPVAKTNVPGPIDFSKQGGVAKTTPTPTPADNTAVKTTPANPVESKPAVTADNRPYIVTSLATGIDAKGLAKLMQTAEEQMRQGKFTEAVDTYDTAQEVAPNNPLVTLGRGFAELGASYYGKADLDIGRSISAEPAILAGRYDLKGFLGEDRVKFVHDDLEDIANHEKGARPLVLLSYIAHNGGDDATAARDLDEASKRGGYDQLIKTLREAWNLK